MDGRTLKVTREAPNITVIEGLKLPDFEQLEREAREEKEQTLEHLRGVAHSARRTACVTLAELADIVGLKANSLYQYIKSHKLPHSYGPVSGSGWSGNKMIFTKAEAERIIKERDGTHVEPR